MRQEGWEEGRGGRYFGKLSRAGIQHPKEVEGPAGTLLTQGDGWQGDGDQGAESLCNQRKCLRDLRL